MTPTTLFILDLDGTLYNSPAAPDQASAGAWYYHAHSFGTWGPPGFDPRWRLDVLAQVRRASLDPTALVAVLTARPHHSEMFATIREMITTASLDVPLLQLKPVAFGGSDADFKALSVAKWLRDHPTVRRVVFYDDQPANLAAVGRIVTASGRTYAPIEVR